jgi:hypothetical protein
MLWLAGGLLVGRYMVRQLGIGQFFIPNIVTHPMGFPNQYLVGERCVSVPGSRSEQYQANSDLWCVQRQKLQHWLQIAVVGANNDLVAMAFDGISINLQ